MAGVPLGDTLELARREGLSMANCEECAVDEDNAVYPGETLVQPDPPDLTRAFLVAVNDDRVPLHVFCDAVRVFILELDPIPRR